MRFARLLGLTIFASGFALAGQAEAALQVVLGEVNTSVGIKPTTTANKWKLQTDPSVDPSVTNVFDTYIPSEGSLCNSFDPTKFTLAVNPNTGTYGLGYTVDGLGAYEVLAFDVELTSGGYVDVHANPTPGGPDLVTLLGNTSGTPDGNILNIYYQLIPDRVEDAAPADTDQLFYEINLDQIGTSPTFTPGVVTTFGNVNSFFTVVPTSGSPAGSQPITTDFSATGGIGGGPNFQSSSNVPEPTSLSLLTLGAVALAKRRNRR
jgi:PEP-CTERM motif-containing protein